MRYIDPSVIEMAVAANDLVCALPVGHPVRRLLGEEYLWLGGVAEVREWFRLFHLACGDRLDARRLRGRAKTPGVVPEKVLRAATEILRRDFPTDVIAGPRTSANLHRLFWKAVRAVRHEAILPESVAHQRQDGLHRFIEIASLLILTACSGPPKTP